jgi:hypothetical protein
MKYIKRKGQAVISLSEIYADEGPRMSRPVAKEDYDFNELKALVIHLTKLEIAQETLGKKMEGVK